MTKMSELKPDPDIKPGAAMMREYQRPGEMTQYVIEYHRPTGEHIFALFDIDLRVDDRSEPWDIQIMIRPRGFKNRPPTKEEQTAMGRVAKLHAIERLDALLDRRQELLEQKEGNLH